MRIKKGFVLLVLVAIVVLVAASTFTVWVARRGGVQLDKWEYVKPVDVSEKIRWLTRTADPITLAKGWTWSEQTLPIDEHWFKYVGRSAFEHRRSDDGPVSFVLEANWPRGTSGNSWLNGEQLFGPVPGLFYKTVSGIDPARLKDGLNVLTVATEIYTKKLDVAMEEGRRVEPLSMRLRPQSPRELDILIGPILGRFGPDSFTVSALTNMKAQWSLTVDAAGFTVTPIREQPGFYQTFEITREPVAAEADAMPSPVSYTMQARLPGRERWAVQKSGQVNLEPLGKEWRFVALGDSRTFPERWKRVVTAAAQTNPRFIVHTGDIISNGRVFEQWIDEFSDPARQELATIPFYGVLGNHENDSPIFDKILALPGTRRRWAKQHGDVLLIGIDGKADWMPGSELYDWLKSTLEASDARYILVFSHYPVLSSSGHSRLNKQGDYKEPEMRVGRDHLIPLCEQYGVTAFIAGHEHCYERSETGKLTAITTGGGGAPLYRQRKNWRKHNPYSTVFYKGLHYLVLTVTPEELRMKALTPEGYVLDHREWKPRERSVQ